MSKRAVAALVAVLAGLLAAGPMPASGTYTYAVRTTSGTALTATIVVSSTGTNLSTRESIGVASTTQSFGPGLRQSAYHEVEPQHLDITVSRTSAHYSWPGGTADIPIGTTACVLVDDNFLTSSFVAPAAIARSRAATCAFVLPNGGFVDAPVIAKDPSPRPSGAPAADAETTLQFPGVRERIWFNPRTMVPDYMDFGNGADATLQSAAPAAR